MLVTVATSPFECSSTYLDRAATIPRERRHAQDAHLGQAITASTGVLFDPGDASGRMPVRRAAGCRAKAAPGRDPMSVPSMR
jgi:hypothetical protein